MIKAAVKNGFRFINIMESNEKLVLLRECTFGLDWRDGRVSTRKRETAVCAGFLLGKLLLARIWKLEAEAGRC